MCYYAQKSRVNFFFIMNKQKICYIITLCLNKYETKQLTELERENEALTLQIQKLTSSNASRFHNKSKFNQLDVKESGMNKEDELTLQAELAEQEVRTLKKSLEETQKENENLLCAIKYLRNKVEQREGSRCATPFGEPKGAREELDKLSKPSEEELELKKQLEESKKEFLVLKDKYELLLEEMEQTSRLILFINFYSRIIPP